MPPVRKRSRKREAILECIRSTDIHPSAEWIYEQLRPRIPDLSLGTVYRNLRLFLAEGEIMSVGVVDGLERYDGNTSPHVHFICERCGAVIDVAKAPAPGELTAQLSTVPPLAVSARAVSSPGEGAFATSMTAPQRSQMKWTWGEVLPSNRSSPSTTPTETISPSARKSRRLR